MTAVLAATSDPGSPLQEFIGSITGRPRGFALVYLGRRYTGYTGSTTVVDAAPGLYLVRDVTTSPKVRGGNAPILAERFVVVWRDNGVDLATEVSDTQAIDLADRLEDGERIDWHEIGLGALREARRTPDLPIELDDAPSATVHNRAMLEREIADLRDRLANAEGRLAALVAARP